jgi:anti-anti-sigma regulatory factor
MVDDGGSGTRSGTGDARAAGSGFGPAARGGAGYLAFDNPRLDVYRVCVTGPLDALTGNRVLRLIDARLRVIALGGSPTRTIVVDLTRADPAESTGLDALGQAHRSCRTAGVTFCVLGAGRLAARLPADTRHRLGQIPTHPTLDAVLAHLTPPAEPGSLTPTTSGPRDGAAEDSTQA